MPRILISRTPRVECQNKYLDVSGKKQLILAQYFKLYSRPVEKPTEIVKIGIDVVQLAFMTVTWSLIWKTLEEQY